MPKEKKTYVGIGLFVGGSIATYVLFSSAPSLMGVGHVMMAVGILLLGNGLARRKKGTGRSSNSPGGNTGRTAQATAEYCARCGKNLVYAASPVSILDGIKYCADCTAAIERDIENQHTICSVCGVDMPIENMHEIGGVLLCHACFLKKYGDVDSYDEPGSASDAEDITASLRK